MTAKEYLREIRQQDEYVEQLRIDLIALRERAVSLSQTYSEGIRGGSTNDTIATAVSKIMEQEALYRTNLERLLDRKGKAVEMISRMRDSRHKTVLHMYYMSGMTFEEVAVEMGKSWRHIIRLHGNALVALEEENKSFFV